MKQVLLFVAFNLCRLLGNCQTDITLRKSFIDSLKNTVTYNGRYLIVKAHEHPNPAEKDGDLHIAVTEKSIGLPVVAEIMNATHEEEALDVIHKLEGSTKRLNMTGVWRLWPEHGGREPQIQGHYFPEYENTNPDHVFEIHPVLTVDKIDVTRSLVTVEGYEAHDAVKAFTRYSKAKCTARKVGANLMMLSMKNVPYNYVHFWIKVLPGTEKKVKDGKFVNCLVLDSEAQIVAEDIRMVFPSQTDADQALSKLKANKTIEVLGIPRVNLAEVDRLIKESHGNYQGSLPVEMIIVGVYQTELRYSNK